MLTIPINSVTYERLVELSERIYIQGEIHHNASLLAHSVLSSQNWVKDDPLWQTSKKIYDAV